MNWQNELPQRLTSLTRILQVPGGYHLDCSPSRFFHGLKTSTVSAILPPSLFVIIFFLIYLTALYQVANSVYIVSFEQLILTQLVKKFLTFVELTFVIMLATASIGSCPEPFGSSSNLQTLFS